METIHTVKVVNKDRIVGVKFKNPELMHPNAAESVVREYHTMRDKQRELSLARERVRQLEKEFATLEKEWNAKKDMFDIEFEATEKEVKTTKATIGLKNVNGYTA